MSEVRKIHHLVEDFEERFDLDPVRGVVRKRVSVIAPSKIHAISHDGTVYKIGKDGSFEVPAEVARFYLARPGWHEGPGIPLLPTPEEMEADLAAQAAAKKPRAKE